MKGITFGFGLNEDLIKGVLMRKMTFRSEECIFDEIPREIIKHDPIFPRKLLRVIEHR